MNQNNNDIYSAIFNHAVDGIILGSPEAIITDVNDSFLIITGLERDDVIGKHIKELFPVEVLKQTPLRFDKLAKGETVISEREIIRKDGTTVHAEMHSKQMPDGSFHSFVRDISERKKAEDSLKFFRKAVENSTDAIGMSTPEGKHYYQNIAFDELFGLGVEEVSSPHVKATIYADENIGEEVFKTIIAGGEWHGEIKMIGKNNTPIEVYLRAYSLKDEDGKVIGLVGVHNDITERKIIEAELDNHNRLLTTLLENLHIGVFMVEAPSGKPLIANETAKKILGRGIIEETDKNNIAEIYAAYKSSNNELYPADEMPIFRGMDGQTTRIDDMIVVQPNGEKVLLEVYGSPVYNRNNEIIASIVSFIDITEKAKLVESAQRADKLESLGILAGGIAHDFNNLLGGIYGSLNMAKASDKVSDIKSYLDATFSTINRARGLTQQLLTFARGGSPIRKNVDIAEFLTETVEFALSGSNVSSRFNIAEDLWISNIDKSQISQVIENIVINAQQAMPKGGTIEVIAENTIIKDRHHANVIPGEHIIISIKDQGVGIPNELLARVFDPFFSTKTKGHGLGLATSYSIINRHGGVIEVESELGKGSTFRICLPAISGSIHPESFSYDLPHKGEGTILVMDDQKIIRDTVSVMLKSFGYSVFTTKNGEEAIEFVKAELKADRIIIGIILDLTIPGGMGGKDAVVELLKITKDIPVFVASGYAEDPVMADPQKYGFTASISKPFTLNELAEMLNKCLRKF